MLRAQSEDECCLLRLLQSHATKEALEESKPEHTEGYTLPVFLKVLSVCYFWTSLPNFQTWSIQEQNFC